jgi:hypothetical protein
MKFTLDRAVVEGRSQTYRDAQAAEASPLAKKLFEIPGVASLFFMGDFITVTCRPGADWSEIAPRVEESIREHFNQG